MSPKRPERFTRHELRTLLEAGARGAAKARILESSDWSETRAEAYLDEIERHSRGTVFGEYAVTP